MDHPWWKKAVSYITDVSLEQTSSLYNPFLEVLLVKGRHQLTTRDAIYSYDDKYENFSSAFRKVNWKPLKGNRVLVLGLGLGSVILILEKILNKTFDYTAVEIDPEICRMAHSYTLKNLKSYVEVIQAEAHSFLSVNDEKYDMIIMDIFQSAIIPQKFQSKEYLQMLSGKLNSKGVLLYNRMNITEEDKLENKLFDSIMEEVFPNTEAIQVKNNLVYINDKAFLES